MKIRNLRHYWLVLVIGLIGATGCVDVSDPMIASGGVTDDVLFDDDARVVGDMPECLGIGEPSTAVHEAMLEELNAYRVENGLSPLIYSTTLEAAAEAHLQDLWQRGYFSHTTPEGKGPADRAADVGFCHKYVGENLAAGQQTVERAMEAWKNSPSHNENMLHEPYVYVGMGFTEDETGRRYWSQVMAYDIR